MSTVASQSIELSRFVRRHALIVFFATLAIGAALQPGQARDDAREATAVETRSDAEIALGAADHDVEPS